MGLTASGTPLGITPGSEGDVWFTEYDAFKVSRITPTGSIIEVVGTNGKPRAITAGPDGNLWLAEAGSHISIVFVAPPTIAAISPTTALPNTITSVTITGLGFSPGATVTFGGTPAPAIVNNPTSITVTTPNTLGPGSVDVVVTNPGGASGQIRFSFGTPNALPNPEPNGGAPGAPNPLPGARGTGGSAGSPNPLPSPRP